MKKFAAIFLSLFSIILFATEKPILRAGIITDTHVSPDPASVNKLYQALQLFKAEKVDLIINAGDIAEKFYPQGYRHYRNTVKKVFPEGIREIFAYANHDQLPTGKRTQRHPYRDLKNALQITHDPWDSIVINGLPFLTCPQTVESFDVYEKHISDAAKKFPGKPLFVIDHVPPANTISDSQILCCQIKPDILKKFPQIIHISGHIHGDIRNELFIWQGEYTAVNAGCLSAWGGTLVGSAPYGKPSAGVLIMEVYSDKVIFHRKDCMLQKTVAEPWIVPLPHSPKNPHQVFQTRKNASVAPEFPAGSFIKTATDKEKFNELIITFNAAKKQKNTYKYEILLKNKVSKTLISRLEIMGDFFRNNQPETVSHKISSEYFETGKEYLIEIVPINFFGKRGKALRTSFIAPEKAKWTTVFESKKPMKDIPFRSGLSGGNPLPVKDGFYIHDESYGRLIFPEKTWEGKQGTRFRLTVDMHTRKIFPASWNFTLRHNNPKHYAVGKSIIESGDTGVRRYVMDFIKKQDFYNYYFLVRESHPGEIRFEYVKIERLDLPQ